MQDPLLLIDGRLVPGASTMPVVNPATGKEFARAPSASALQLNEAVAAAERAFPSWSAFSYEARRAKVLQIADAIEAHGDALAQILTNEHGKLLAGARAEVNSTIQYFRYFATLSLAPELVEESAVRRVEVHRVPLGVVATIIPWNFPLLLLAFKLPPALLAGNTVVVKAAPSTPLATLRLGALLNEILPAGVVNVLTGDDALGPLLTAHPGIRKVSFTGSTETGKRVMAAGAPTLKRLTLELGGNDAAIVLGDVDVDKTAELIFASAFGTCGQVCRAVKRVYVHASLYDQVCDKLASRAKRAVVGDNDTPDAEFGPVQNRAHYDRLVKLLADSEACGTVMPGGGPLERDGFFIRPTIVRDIAPQSRLVCEEQFGPILPVLRFDSVDDVVAQANQGPFGLAASVWSADLQQALSIADRLNVGTVFVNKHIDRVPHVPMAGAKQSGIGVELGAHGLNEFTQIKVFNVSAPA